MESAREGLSRRMIFDMDHAYLEFKVSGKNLIADFYAADYFSASYPKAKEVSDFAKLEKAVIDITRK